MFFFWREASIWPLLFFLFHVNICLSDLWRFFQHHSCQKWRLGEHSLIMQPCAINGALNDLRHWRLRQSLQCFRSFILLHSYTYLTSVVLHVRFCLKRFANFLFPPSQTLWTLLTFFTFPERYSEHLGGTEPTPSFFPLPRPDKMPPSPGRSCFFWSCVQSEDLRWKGQCPFALVQHTEKFWKIFFQTFRAGMLFKFFSGGNLKIDQPCCETLCDRTELVLSFWLYMFSIYDFSHPRPLNVLLLYQ